MKRLFAGLASFVLAITALAATTVPPQLINPAGSTAGQAIVSNGPSSAPAWGAVSATALAPIAANTVLGNFTGSSAAPSAFAAPSCSTANSALKYTSGTGLSCGTTFALTSGDLSQFSTTTSAQLAGVISNETGTGVLVFGTSPTLTTPVVSGGTIDNATVGATTPSTGSFTNLTASGTLTGFPGRLIAIQRITATGTYTPTTGTNSVVVHLVGGGGAGGGAPATAAGQQSAGASGGTGAYAISRLTSGFSGVTVTIGAAGAGASGAAGGNGGQSSFGALMTAPGGTGGGVIAAGAAAATAAGGNGGAVATGGNVLNMGGQPGGSAIINPLIVGPGGNGPFGVGGQASFQTNNSPTTGFGGAGGGTMNGASQGALTGGAGTAGVAIIYEYS